MQPHILIEKWSASGAAESSNAQSFTNDLCDLIGVAHPDPTGPVDVDNAYVFEKSVRGRNGNLKFIDCYKRGHFVLENKQGAAAGAVQVGGAMSATRKAQLKAAKTGHGKRGTKTWDTAMEKARKQAENYARLLAGDEIAAGRPPFIMVADVGHSVAVYADWSGHAAHYQPFPDPNNYRIKLADLHDEAIRERLRLIWTDPQALNPARNSARVTKEVADYLAQLAKSLEGKHDTEAVAGFLMRCLFTMFAEDVKLLDDDAFTRLLKDCVATPDLFVPLVTELWTTMNTGGVSVTIRQKIRHFNGGLFADTTVLPLGKDQIQLLLDAARTDWREVEPAIFGTLLERALNPRERHKLGAHYTPRAYVERLVQPTILEPLRKEWEGVQAAALLHLNDENSSPLGGLGGEQKAITEVERFLQRLADLRVLDPACGSANFLYVTLELLKRLEGEVQNLLRDLGQGQISIGLTGATITPENMLGIELNPRAAKIAELVLWIGYLQWHLRSTGSLSDLGSPILRDYHNIENRDAVLEWDRVENVLNDDGEPLTRWDGETYKTHPVTGEQVPDDAARTRVQRIVGGRAAAWPKADFIVGNPPFIGTSRMRETLGDGYTEALRKVYKKTVPASADFVMFWWDKAAELVRTGKTERFGFITTNSIRQTFNRRVIQYHMNQKKPLSLAFAIPDHPWVDSADGAAVRIAMTLGVAGESLGKLFSVLEEMPGEEAPVVVLQERVGKIQSDLTIGPNVAGITALKSNSNVSSRGYEPGAKGFILEPQQRKDLMVNPSSSDLIKPYLNGTDLSKQSRGYYIIDTYDIDKITLSDQYPEIYQWLNQRVKPIRSTNRDKRLREKWWLHRRSRGDLRKSVKGLTRYLATVETSKNRFFTFIDNGTAPDDRLVVVAVDDAYFLGVLSSIVFSYFTLATSGTLEDRPKFNNTRSFETFPFPPANAAQKVVIRDLAERLDAHRKRRQSLHPKLTMTGMYNVLEKERAGELLTDKERQIHNEGLVGILRELHDELDAAVARAYGWPVDLPEAEILQRLVDLNAERAAEEARGHVRWLRPEYQAPEEAAAVQSELDLAAAPAVVVTEKRKWNAQLPKAEKFVLLRDLLASAEGPLSLAAIADAFKPKLNKARLGEVEEMLRAMEVLGQADGFGDGWRT